MPNPIPPSVGRVVLYIPTGNTSKGQPYPAIITHVFSDECVNLFVCPDGSFGNADGSHTSVVYDQDKSDGTWHWMDYQLGQAERTRQAEEKLAS